MSTWDSTPQNFAHTWNIVANPRFVIEEGASANELKVTPRGVRGLVGGTTYLGVLTSDTIRFAFLLEANGIAGGNKQLTFSSMVEGSTPVTATGPASSDPNWDSTVAGFDGTWDLAGGGQFEIQNQGQIQCINVPGLDNLLYQGTFDNSGVKSNLKMIFDLSNDGFVDDDPNKPKELAYAFPEVLHIPGVPTESERYEDNESGGGG